MRIRKGCIGINYVKDVQLLRQVLRSTLVTHDQLWAFMYYRVYELKRHSFNWRVRRLVESGLLARHQNLKYTENYLYSTTNAGADVLIGQGEWFPMLPEEGGFKERVSVAHTLALNDLQLALIRENVLKNWKPEPIIRFENKYMANHHAKDFDAIVTVQIDHGESVFNLEYERTAKRYSDYAKIRECFEQERNLKPVLYVVPDFQLLRVLLHAFWGTSAPVFICLAGHFTDFFTKMKVTKASSGELQKLEVIL